MGTIILTGNWGKRIRNYFRKVDLKNTLLVNNIFCFDGYNKRNDKGKQTKQNTSL